MVHAVRHRGPDGTAHVIEDAAAFGHAMLHTTPESLNEVLPTTSRNAAFLLTCDARLDNRDELLGGYLDRYPGDSDVSDSTLILWAYEIWGDRCVDRLIGDFAFAVYDKVRNGVFCARDHFGVKPLYYCLTETRFAFASEQKALLVLDFADPTINRTRVDQFIVSCVADDITTFYNGIFRLAPAHTLFVNAETVSLTRYWKLDPLRELPDMSDEEYVKEFLYLFRQSVSCRLRAAKPIGSFLSGGLDSASIACIAASELAGSGQRLSTISAVFPDFPECDETKYIKQIASKLDVDTHLFDCSNVNPLDNLNSLTESHDEPVPSIGMYRAERLLSEASSRGVRIMLDGHDGDTTISHGIGFLSDLADAGKWGLLWSEVKVLSKVFNRPALPTFWTYFESVWLRPKIDQRRGLCLARRLWLGVRRRIFDNREARRTVFPWSHLTPSGRSVVPAICESQNNEPAAPACTNERISHYNMITMPLCSLILESLDKTSAAKGIEMRYPFWDKRLVEFCLAMPVHLKLGKGWSRLVLRLSMKAVLPEQVQWRKEKTDFSKVLCNNMLVQAYSDVNSLVGTNHAIRCIYLNEEAVRASVEVFRRNPVLNNLNGLYPALALTEWVAVLEARSERNSINNLAD